jgi:hypothetical protein
MNRRNFFVQALSRSVGAIVSSRTLCSVSQTQLAKSNRVVWSPVSKNIKGDPITEVTYNVYRGLCEDGSDGIRLNSVPISMTNYVDSDIGTDSIYYYSVAAVSMAGIEGQRSVIKVGGK